VTEAIILLAAGLIGCSLIAMCDRGIRPAGISFFDVIHESNRASRRAKR
jgi:hypothetical protein